MGLFVNSNVTLSGALIVAYNTKNAPKGLSYTAMTFGSLSGEFTSVTNRITLKYTKNSIVAKLSIAVQAATQFCYGTSS